jgi:alkylation response protein AidB-like acyl-CoA dehydrogenase
MERMPDRGCSSGNPSAERFHSVADVVAPAGLGEAFPQQSQQDESVGRSELGRLSSLLTTHVDPNELEKERHLPEGLLDHLKRGGFLNLELPGEYGGLALSGWNAFQLISLASSWSMPVGLILAVQAAIGAGAYLPAIPPGPLREFVADRVRQKAVSGLADTEPFGGFNNTRMTTARADSHKDGFRLSGTKVTIGNAPIADVLAVTATFEVNGENRIRLAFVDAQSPGLQVRQTHEFMGLKGFPNGAVTFEDVYVPREQVLIEEDRKRLTPAVMRAICRGRLFLIAAPALAIAKLCLLWARNFAKRRKTLGRSLGEYAAIQENIVQTMADTFAIESLARWCLLGNAQDGVGEFKFEEHATKNKSSTLVWGVIDRTMSLLASEGFETPASKAKRGVPPIPLERFYRDARALRISGGVDFALDLGTGLRAMMFPYYGLQDFEKENSLVRLVREHAPGDLSAENRGHATWVRARVELLDRVCRELCGRYRSIEALGAKQTLLISLGRLGTELLTAYLVLLRASSVANAASAAVQQLADVYCSSARRCVEQIIGHLQIDEQADFASLSHRWLGTSDLDFLVDGVIADLPPAGNSERGEILQ